MRALAVSFVLLLTACAAGRRTMIIDSPGQRDAAVGQVVTLRGVVENSKIAALVGVDLDADSPDLRGRPATATGRLERWTVTQDEIDRDQAEHGISASRGAGTFYRLVDPATGTLAKAQPAP